MTQTELGHILHDSEVELPEELLALLDRVREYHPQADTSTIVRAYRVAEYIHRGERRASGEPYITHPLAVAGILAELEMDVATISAGLMHDVVEDGKDENGNPRITIDDIRLLFGEEIALLVDGVTKLASYLDVERELEETTDSEKRKRKRDLVQTAANLRKIFVAMSRDLRVMIIKLADRLHNMRTLDALSRERQVKIATETLQILAPMAHRLGIWQIKWQLEDLAFKYLEPEKYAELAARVQRTRKEREEDINEAIRILKERLERERIRAEVHGRPKHLYSIYQKMLKEEIDLDQIYDLLAIRVIVDTVPDCYHALGVVHDLWLPIPGRFDDYIAKPKPNMYQSLHTKVIGPRQQPLEVQIRTWEMHRTADFGIAAHWQYKEGGTSEDRFEQRMRMLRQQLFEWQADGKDSTEFLRSVVETLFNDQVFAFTPKGDVIDLVAGSTPVDFAYRVHTDVGNTCVGAKVNGRIVPLHYQLKNGDIVEIITRPNARPSRDWLNFVKTPHARSKIKQYFRKQAHAENVARGREMLEREVERLGLDPKEVLHAEALELVAKQLNLPNAEEVYAAVGDGRYSAQAVLNRILPRVPLQPSLFATGKVMESETRLSVDGIDNVMIRRAKCCTPLPGDDVVGYTSRGRGITLHRRACVNVQNYLLKEPERLVAVRWDEKPGACYATSLHIEAADRTGLLSDISTVFGESKTNITAIRTLSRPDGIAYIDITVEVQGVSHLRSLMDKVRRISDVLDIRRTGTIGEAA
ncbi:MAG: bifunctional (p)ppGpp synthetase/guanosine-3',5'-bis(diphosphate) 3'-pyrophosphohydrolase [Armatimonadota bacterium]|nr:bifunctional (p)ppGpp synthetase/guanosine-3',5'-bis(diphosphate) 3'-pyrophosphohydrolase [bacterium]MDW8290128.1 bifunctional (p)ppGpp synthetase/guanosine-3',5'-bis(diphosphate) 3'-pyrophosphohydrolase [Armatimonadota bacterium]